MQAKISGSTIAAALFPLLSLLSSSWGAGGWVGGGGEWGGEREERGRVGGRGGDSSGSLSHKYCLHILCYPMLSYNIRTYGCLFGCRRLYFLDVKGYVLDITGYLSWIPMDIHGYPSISLSTYPNGHLILSLFIQLFSFLI